MYSILTDFNVDRWEIIALRLILDLEFRGTLGTCSLSRRNMGRSDFDKVFFSADMRAFV
jgi:hypothetical protein